MTKIALFGTSADPPTSGHQAILRWLSNHYDQVLVWASDNPYKLHQTPLAHRTAMLRLVIEEIQPCYNNVSLHEELSDRRSLISVEKAMAIWGTQIEYALVIGSDLISQIQDWYRIKELLHKVQILVVPRNGYPINEKDVEKLRSLGGKCHVINIKIPPVSSTSYREQRDKNAITESVAKYINREKLYA